MFQVEITRTGISAIGRQGYRDVGRAAIYAAALLWVQRYLPLHFENIAYRRYRYAIRSRGVARLKREQQPWPHGEHTAPAIGEVKPLVFSGRSRESALRNPNIDARATDFQNYRASVTINAPAFNFSTGKRIDLNDEATRFTPQEERSMELEFAREFEQQLVRRGLSLRKTTRIAA